MARKTPAQKRAEVAALRERLDEFTEDLDEAAIALITATYKYSPRNAMLIAMQRPDATDVAGFKAWRDRGRSVIPGESGIQILAPAGRKDAVEADPDNGVEAEDARQFFRLVYVFDVAQTEPLEVAKARWEAKAAERAALAEVDVTAATEAAQDALAAVA